MDILNTRQPERLVLTGADRDVFLYALENPAKPTERLVAALKRHRELFGSGQQEPEDEGRRS